MGKKRKSTSKQRSYFIFQFVVKAARVVCVVGMASRSTSMFVTNELGITAKHVAGSTNASVWSEQAEVRAAAVEQSGEKTRSERVAVCSKAAVTSRVCLLNSPWPIIRTRTWGGAPSSVIVCRTLTTTPLNSRAQAARVQSAVTGDSFAATARMAAAPRCHVVEIRGPATCCVTLVRSERVVGCKQTPAAMPIDSSSSSSACFASAPSRGTTTELSSLPATPNGRLANASALFKTSQGSNHVVSRIDISRSAAQSMTSSTFAASVPQHNAVWAFFALLLSPICFEIAAIASASSVPESSFSARMAAEATNARGRADASSRMSCGLMTWTFRPARMAPISRTSDTCGLPPRPPLSRDEPMLMARTSASLSSHGAPASTVAGRSAGTIAKDSAFMARSPAAEGVTGIPYKASSSSSSARWLSTAFSGRPHSLWTSGSPTALARKRTMLLFKPGTTASSTETTVQELSSAPADTAARIASAPTASESADRLSVSTSTSMRPDTLATAQPIAPATAVWGGTITVAETSLPRSASAPTATTTHEAASDAPLSRSRSMPACMADAYALAKVEDDTDASFWTSTSRVAFSSVPLG
eukprot:m.125946 g.125946  ORF g.125946 m.125946 type:complete len:588 (+) comp16325_c0_seq2:81-1844(+)